jgi:flagellar biosynthesis chaperone FliJ
MQLKRRQCRGADHKAGWEHEDTQTTRFGFQVQELVTRWEEKYQDNDSFEGQNMQQFLTELKEILASRKNRHHHAGKCHVNSQQSDK